MKSGLTPLYLQHYKEFREQEIDELKSLLQIRAIHHKVEDVVSDYKRLWYDKMKDIQQEKYDQDNNFLKSYFRERLFEIFKSYLPYNFYDDEARFDYEIERILDRPLQEVMSNFQYNYETADETTKYRRFFDYEEVVNLKEDDLTKMLAEYHALYRFIDEVDLLAIELDKQIEDEKRLVKENKFNDLTPIEVYDFFLQLVNRIPKESKPMLTKDQVITLTNMICRNVDVVKKIKADVKNRKGQLRYFVYKFYLHSKNSSTGAEESNFKYISILTRYIVQFNNIKVNNFATEPRKFDVNLHDKYLH